MQKFAAFLVLNLVSFAAGPGNAQTIIGNSNQPAVTTCNIVTGVATGVDSGTCANPRAICNGVADDARAFRSFNAWARATTANKNGQLIELQVSGTCMFTSGSVNANPVLTGLRNVRLMGYGATFSSPHGNGFKLGGSGVCQKGIADARGCSARLATVSAGAASVTLLNTSLCSRFMTGRWAVVTGFDLQGTFKSAYGFPPNPHYFDYVQIASTANCASTGLITLGSALTNSYLSTWPLYSGGNALEADQGGPATIYALDPTWDTEVDIRGLAIDSPNGATGAAGRLVTFRDITLTGSLCIWPSQALVTKFINVIGTNCDIEMDKLVGTVSFTNVLMKRIHTQSSSIDNLVVSGSTFSNGISGTPKVATISNSTIPSLTLGPLFYGVPTSATCTNCVINNVIAAFGLTEKGPSDVGTNKYYTVSSGVFSNPDGINITGYADNGSGKIRLSVPSTQGWATGAGAGNHGILTNCPGNQCPPGAVLTIVDSTQIDLLDLNFADYTWTGGGMLVNSAPRWAVPGANVSATGALGPGVPFFQVTGVTQDSAGTHIATTLPGSYPTVPLTSGKSYLVVQAPKWTCTNCIGNAQAVDFSGAPPNIPFASYSKRTWTNSTPLVNYPLWGKARSIKISVTQAYKGAANPLRFDFAEATVVPPGRSSFWLGRIDLRTAGLRTITPSGVTCDTGRGPVAGGCGADSGLKLPDPATMFAQNLHPQKNDGSPTDQPWTISAEFIMDQGVVP